MSEFIMISLFVVGVLITISSIDDFFIDVLALRFGRRRGADPLANVPARDHAASPSIGVFVANWHEHEVLGRMVSGNLARLHYRPLKLYLGVYPNDHETVAVAKAMAVAHPNEVEVIINRLDGPTSKGQMLNEMFELVYGPGGSAPDMVVLHDSEDLIDPRSLDVYASFSQHYSFIQIPVFSLEAGERSLVAGTYMDEFAERHTGELLVRDAVGAAIPSAGVGTCITRDLILHMLAERGHVLMPGCVTEDYILGVEAHRAGFKCTFTAVSGDTAGLRNPADAIVATREYFPRTIWTSVKQKTRWTYGIAFEATRKLGWQGGAWDLYFFFRDRKGVVCNMLPILSGVLMLICLFAGYEIGDLPDWMEPPFIGMALINGLAIVWRMWSRMSAFKEVHGRYDPIAVLMRWLLAIVINAWAVGRAWYLFLGPSKFATQPITWSKTQHELPDDFGEPDADGTNRVSA
jgi:bacteriophage N4 adsorption protein B